MNTETIEKKSDLPIPNCFLNFLQKLYVLVLINITMLDVIAYKSVLIDAQY